jgi:hypothetical protein
MEPLVLRGLTMCLIDATLAAGTTTTISTTGTTHYLINGKAYTKAAITNGATPTTDVNTGEAFTAIQPSEGGVFVVGLNANGDVKVAQGEITDLTPEADGANTSFVSAPDFPALPEDFCPVGYILTKVGASGSAWTFGSSNLAGPPSNVLHTIVSVGTLPTRPQTS